MKDWKVKPFGEICEIVGGSQPPKNDFIYEPREGYVRLIQVRDYKTDKFITYIPKDKAKRFCNKTDIMIGRYGPPIFGIFRGLEGAYNVALMKAVPDEKIVNKEYFYWFLKTDKLVKFVEKTSKRAVGQDGVRKERLYSYPVPTPPLPEQKRIVAILDQTFAAINKAKANAEQNLKNAKELFESYLQGVFGNKGDDWEIVKISDICETIIDCINKTAPICNEETPYKMIRTTNIRNGRVDLSSVKFVTEEIYKLWTRRQKPAIGDILFTREAPMGEAGMLLSNENVFLGQRIVSYRVNSRKADKKFILYAFHSQQIKNQIKSLASGATVQHLRVPHTKNFEFALPSLKEQKNIVKKLNTVSEQTKKLESIYQQKIDNLEELRKSILQKAFNGELTQEEIAV